MSNVGNVIGGHKANLHNPNSSEESKEHSKEFLEKTYHTGVPLDADEGKDPAHVAAGLKAAIHNPNVSEEAKNIAQQRLDSVAK